MEKINLSRRFKVSRRGLMLGATGLAATRLGMPYIGNAEAAEPIKIGMIWAKTGNIVDQAEYLAQGTMLALEQRNNTVLGRPAEIVWLDEPNPQGAQQNAEKLISEHKVVGMRRRRAVVVCAGDLRVAKKTQDTLCRLECGGGRYHRQACNKYTFRLQPPVDVHTSVLAPVLRRDRQEMVSHHGLLRFRPGHQEILHGLHHRAMAARSSAPTRCRSAPPDYSSFILKIRAAKPDVVIGGVSAGDLTTFLKQWNELGMRGKIPFAEIAVGNTDLWGVGPEAADGLYTITWWYKNPANPPDEQEMAAAYMKKYNRPAADKAWMGWLGMKSLLELIEAAKTTDPAAIVECARELEDPAQRYRCRLSQVRSSDDQPSSRRRHPCRRSPTSGTTSTSRPNCPRPRKTSGKGLRVGSR